MEQIKFLGVSIIIAALILGGALIYSTSVRQAATPPSTPTPLVTSTATSQATTLSPSRNFDLSGKTLRGSVNAQITVIEFGDFQCPFCGSVKPTVDKLLSDYQNKIKFYYFHFPLDFHEFAQKSAEASECAGAQGKFWEYHDVLFENQNALDVASLKNYAKQLGLDSGKFDSCLDSGSMAGKVRADMQQGITVGVSGTPSFFINGVQVCGAQPYAAFKQVVDALLAGQRPADVC